ncbi:MAG: hypothetical protein ABSB71_10020 [Candidatus Bathyarchaeia archaeon]|jgi:hypothetical protein
MTSSSDRTSEGLAVIRELLYEIKENEKQGLKLLMLSLPKVTVDEFDLKVATPHYDGKTVNAVYDLMLKAIKEEDTKKT